MNDIKFTIAAKTDVGLVRTNNEDNLQVDSDLYKGEMRWVNNQECSLGPYGALLVVADGMGGMNAGEVASAIAIDTVREMFVPDKLKVILSKGDVSQLKYVIEKHLKETIVLADTRIKKHAQEYPETHGMGTTIVIGWLYNGFLYLAWCGDSRAYVYNPKYGLHQISKDHSYVQSLVDSKKITHEMAFDYPESNIITRCLCDGSVKANPECALPYEVCENDIIMLCTDGLSGMLRDQEMEEIIKANSNNMNVLADTLIKSACDAEGSDNITLCLCKILKGGISGNPEVYKRMDCNIGKIVPETPQSSNNRNIWILCAVSLVLCLGGLGWWYFRPDKQNEESVEKVEQEAPTSEDVVAPETETTPPVAPMSVKEKTQDKETSKKPNLSIGGLLKVGSGEAEEEPVEPITEQEVPGAEDEDELTKVPGAVTEEGTGDEKPTLIPQTNNGKYVVQEGDTWEDLAKKFDISAKKLKEMNNHRPLTVGVPITVPKK